MKTSVIISVLVLIVTVFFVINIWQHHSAAGRSSINFHLPSVILSTEKHVIHEEVVVKKPKIAYLFAGSVRSFVCPRVHWTIKANLIDSLDGESYSFVRLSLEDNKNSKTGTGVLWNPPYESGEVEDTLKLLNPVAVEYYSLSTQIEEMKREFPTPIHTVFRENDQRRYSMYYHRCMAYRMVLKYEREHNIKFDWIVLARLDAAWLEPIYPISTYANDRVWLTETGLVMLNDQFMLIPRQFSDYLYDLNTKVTQKVYCLGGPDVEQWKCNATELMRRRIPLHTVTETLPYCCSDVLGMNINGFSETIHYRHLQEGQIPIGIYRFPVALSRRDEAKECRIECFRLHAYHFKDYLFNYRPKAYKYMPDSTFPDTSGRAISVRDKLMCHIVESKTFPWKPITAHELHKSNSLFDQSTIDYSKSLFSQMDKVDSSIFMNTKFTEAWRIRPTFNVDGCLTLSFLHKNLTWRACNDHSAVHHLRYDPRQVFFLHVLTPNMFSPILDVKGKELVHNFFYSNNVSSVTRVQISHWRPYRFEFTGEPRCLTVADLSLNAAVTAEPCSPNLLEPKQLFQSIQPTFEVGSHYQSVIGQLRLAKRSVLCVGRAESKKVLNSWVPEHDQLILTHCVPEATYHLVNFEFEMVLS